MNTAPDVLSRQGPVEAYTQRSTRKTHELKTDPEAFDAVARGDKTFEIRFNDRGFSVGDELWLRETKFSGAQMHMRPGKCPLVYTSREERRIVSHVLTGYGLDSGWCCLSFATIVAASPSDTSQGVSEARLEWLHSPASNNVDGYEWGIYRVKWVNGKAAEVWQTNADFSDLDEAMHAALRSEPTG